MSDAVVVPASPEEYRAMLDEIGVHTRVVEDGIEGVWWRGRRSLQVMFRRAENGWWDVMTVNAFGRPVTLLWSSAYANKDTRTFIDSWLRSQR